MTQSSGITVKGVKEKTENQGGKLNLGKNTQNGTTVKMAKIK